MKKLLILLFLISSSSLYSQNLTTVYIDRCTGAATVFTVPMNGQTTVAFYNRARTFTSQQFQSGELQAWLEETYLWWSSLNPCSTTSTGAATTQQTTQQVTQQATQAANNAVANTPIDVPVTPQQQTQVEVQAPTVEPPLQVDNAPPTVDSTPSAEPTPTGAESTDNVSTESQGPTESSEAEAPATESTETQEDSSSTSEGTEDTTSEDSGGDSGDGETSEESEEQVEETTEEETTEEETTEEESEETTEESEEEEETKKEDKKKKKKKRALAPPIISANLMSMQDPTGKFSTAATFGLSQSSLRGDKTYGLNTMIYSNFKQLMLTANFSKTHINKEGRVDRVYSASIGGAKIYTSYMTMMNHSLVFLGKKGSVAGVAFGTSLTAVEVDVRDGLIFYDEQIIGASLTGFFTKPYNFDRWSVAPMLAVSSPFASYAVFGDGEVSFNKDLMFIGGASFTYQLTKRFVANIGVNAIEATIPEFPLIMSFTIGSRFNF